MVNIGLLEPIRMNRENLAPQVEAKPYELANRLYKRYLYPITEDGYCYYAITVKCNLLDRCTRSDDIQTVINDKFKKFTIHTQVWELDKRSNLHCHMLASYKQTCQYKNFRKYGWNIHAEQLLTPGAKSRWERYLEKDQENDILLRQESLYYNLFE